MLIKGWKKVEMLKKGSEKVEKRSKKCEKVENPWKSSKNEHIWSESYIFSWLVRKKCSDQKKKYSENAKKILAPEKKYSENAPLELLKRYAVALNWPHTLQ